MIEQIRNRFKKTIENIRPQMAAFFFKGKMESYLVAEILMENEDVSNEIIGLKEFTVKKRQQIELIFCKNLYVQKGRYTTDHIYLALDFKKWYRFNAINGFAKEHITAIQSDMRKLKELKEVRPEAST